jgi:hypothetical protein
MLRTFAVAWRQKQQQQWVTADVVEGGTAATGDGRRLDFAIIIIIIFAGLPAGDRGV